MRSSFLVAMVLLSVNSLAYAGDGSSVGAAGSLKRMVSTLELDSTEYRRLKIRLDRDSDLPVALESKGVAVEKVGSTMKTIEPNPRVVLPKGE